MGAQFFIVAMFLLMAFVILSVAVMVAGNTSVGVNGIVLVGVDDNRVCSRRDGIYSTGTVPGPRRSKWESFVRWWEFATDKSESKDLRWDTCRIIKLYHLEFDCFWNRRI